jgi:catechol 2,3-dioxygenase-like lactoylglutathione lyase family enzyme
MLSFSRLVAFIPTKDAQTARPFYENVLGLRMVGDDTFALVFECNGATLRVVRAAEFTPAPFTVLGWHVPDVHDAVAELSKNGLVFERFQFEGMHQDEAGVWTTPAGNGVAWFKDPDGNLLSVSD